MEFHAQSAGAGDVEAELQGRHVAGLMVRNGRHVGGHDAGGIDEVRRILDEHTREGVRIVAGPDLVEILQGAVVHPAAARRAALDDDVGILFTQEAHDVVDPLCILHEEAVLLRAQVFAARIGHDPVAVPFDVVDLVRQLHRVVEDAVHEILHGRIAQIQHPLVPALVDLPARALDNPFRVSMGQVTLRIDHFRLDPDTELQPLVMGIGSHIINSFREFGRIDFPVAEAGVVPVAGIILRKPAVVQDEHLEAHGRGIVDHPEQGFGREGEISAFPTVQERGIDLTARIHSVVPGPGVQIPGGLAGTPLREGVDEIGRDESLPGSQFVGRCIRADAGKDIQPSGLVHLEGKAEVAAPRQGSGDDLTGRFFQAVRIETHQERRIVALRDLRTAAGFDDFGVVREEFAVHLHLIGPAAMEMREIILVSIQIEGAGRIILKFHGLLCSVQDLRMRDDDVLLLISVIDDFDFLKRNVVFQKDFRRDDVSFFMDLVPRIIQFSIVVAVGILHMEGRFADIAATGGGIGHGATAVVIGTVGGIIQISVGISDEGPVMQGLEDTVFLDAEDQLGMGRLHGNHLPLHRRNLHDRMVVGFLLLFPGRCGRSRDG